MPVFYSPHAGYRLLIRDQRDKRHPVTGDIIETVPSIWVDFGKYGEVQTFVNPETGETHEGAQIVGHYYDTEAEAADRGWDQETHDLVVRRLRDAERREPYRLQEQQRTRIPAPLPWPTYDGCDAATAVELAKTLGVVAQVVAYERENLARPTVLDGLAAAPDDDVAADEPEPDLPPAAVKAAPAGSNTITV